MAGATVLLYFYGMLLFRSSLTDTLLTIRFLHPRPIISTFITNGSPHSSSTKKKLTLSSIAHKFAVSCTRTQEMSTTTIKYVFMVPTQTTTKSNIAQASWATTHDRSTWPPARTIVDLCGIWMRISRRAPGTSPARLPFSHHPRRGDIVDIVELTPRVSRMRSKHGISNVFENKC
jgi:hypothetical protein